MLCVTVNVYKFLLEYLNPIDHIIAYLTKISDGQN